jgi:hypothetical protein
LLIATLVLVLLAADISVLSGAGPTEVHAAGPWNAILGLFRVGGALHRRNRVYEEAGATAPEINAYYDRLIEETQQTRREVTAQAVAGEAEPRMARAYTRLEAALKEEREAAIQMIEAEKNEARQAFERTLTREVVRILIASPGGQRILGDLREAVSGAREAAKAVQIAAEEGRPIEALQDALAEKAGDIPLVQAAARELGSAVGHQVDRALGGLLTKLDRAVDNVQTGMDEALDALEKIDAELAAHDQTEREPVSVVEDESLIAEVVPVDRVNAAADVAATAFTRAAEIQGALDAGTSRDTMRDRVRGALLTGRVQEIRGAAAGDLGQHYCTAVGRGEYEVAAEALGQTPQAAGEDESGTYLVCYDIETQAPILAKALGKSDEAAEEEGEATAEPSPTPEEEAKEGEIPVGTYKGTTIYPSFLDSLLAVESGTTSTDEVVINVAEDGTVTGSLVVDYTSDTHHAENDDGPCTVVWHCDIEGSFSGQLSGPSGTIEVTETWNTYITQTGTCLEVDEEPYVSTLEVDVEVSGDQMTGSALLYQEAEEAEEYFTATKQ